jgi:uncharacterized protein YegP (UPF0339 family)
MLASGPGLRQAQPARKAGEFRFHLKAPNGEIIAASQGYATKASAENGIEAIETYAPGAKVEAPFDEYAGDGHLSIGVEYEGRWRRGGIYPNLDR